MIGTAGYRQRTARGFSEDDAADFGFEPVVLLGYRVFERRFGADPSVVGRQVQLNGRALTVIGVMPPGMRLPERDELWPAYRPSSAPDRAPARSARFVAGFGRLRPGTTLAQLQAELDPLAARRAAAVDPLTSLRAE